jgi:gamma-glutamyl-gamma-aminobutyraldehyde dehydrogenase
MSTPALQRDRHAWERLSVEATVLDGVRPAAAVWTADMNVAHRVSGALRGGTVWVNAFDRSSMATPFGGFKLSGSGRDRSPHAIDKYCDLKTIWTAYR